MASSTTAPNEHRLTMASLEIDEQHRAISAVPINSVFARFKLKIQLFLISLIPTLANTRLCSSVPLWARLTNVATVEVDPQKGFTNKCPHELPVPDGENIVAELDKQALFASYRTASKDAHSPHAVWVTDNKDLIGKPIDDAAEKHPNACEHWVRHCEVGTPGYEFIDGLRMENYRFIVRKGTENNMHPYGACYEDSATNQLSTGLIEMHMHHGTGTILIGGLAAEFCVFATARDLRAAGFRVIFNLGATRCLLPDLTKTRCQELAAMGVEFIDSADELREFLPQIHGS